MRATRSRREHGRECADRTITGRAGGDARGWPSHHPRDRVDDERAFGFDEYGALELRSLGACEDDAAAPLQPARVEDGTGTAHEELDCRAEELLQYRGYAPCVGMAVRPAPHLVHGCGFGARYRFERAPWEWANQRRTHGLT
jgi:hypothetical protein